MKEANVRLAVAHAMMWRGLRPLHWNDARSIPVKCPFCERWFTTAFTPDVKGRPDLLGIHPGPMVNMFIEVKDVSAKEKSFPFAEIDEDQRKYLNNWYDEGGMAFIAIGKIVPMGTKTKISEILVVSWGIFRELLNEGTSIPWDWDLYERKPALENRPKSIKEVFTSPANWLYRQLDGSWKFHEDHPIAVLCKEVEVPYFKRKEAK